MRSDDVIREGERVMTVCNACRYCEGYCPVFPAMERRLIFARGDLLYLANLCHNCGECLYACQYAPPHEFAINVPATMSRLRRRSYEEYCWPASLGRAFSRNGVASALATALSMAALLTAYVGVFTSDAGHREAGDFYAVVPHGVMVSLFGAVSVFVSTVLLVGFVRFWRDAGGRLSELAAPSALGHALGDALTLRHLHGNGVDCVDGEETRSPWRRRFHHMTFYGFVLCFASTSVAALYHVVFGWRAPYAYLSLPVVLGTAGGIGLLFGPVGLASLRRRRDPALNDDSGGGSDMAFIALLFLTGLTGLLLLAARERASMGMLLVTHLGFVLALFVMLPYGKFVHAVYRTAALIKYALERSDTERGT